MMRKNSGRQRGQALIESVIACALVLVPLFLAIPIIAKYLDIRSHVVQSARYAAWERTVWFGGDAAEPLGLGGSFSNKWDANEKKDGEIRAEIGARILSETDGSSGFSDNDKSAGGSAYGAKMFWQDRQGNVLANYSDVSGKFSGKDSDGVYNKPSPGLFNELFGPIMDVAAVISNFTVDTHGLYTTKVGLSVRRVAFNPDSGLGGCPGCDTEFLVSGAAQSFSETNVLVANGWSANGPGSLAEYGAHKEKITVYNQVRGLTPASMLKPSITSPNAGEKAFATALKVLKDISLVFFPELSTLDLGRIEVDKVPADRLK